LQIYTFGGFELDLSEETLRRDGKKLNINHRMFQVLRLLIERRGEIVSKEEFFETVWKRELC
jgi:DNA-binding winged helix-turn-helix (wHTH) protein